jgi:quinolinate synthase
MAETADIVTDSSQLVSLPDLGAGCDMADMAETYDVSRAWKEAQALNPKKIIPVTYVNSKASLKAFVGQNEGTVCTSGNAAKIVSWALEHGSHVFFFPDQHLGRNISKKLGLDPAVDMTLWDPALPLGGNTPEKLLSSKVWLWKGHCPVHALFTVHQIKKLRVESPETRIIVHPECSMEVVDLSDEIGSTEQIITAVNNAPKGAKLAIGTEKHLVERLAQEHPDKTITSLNPYTCLCGTMNRISARHLAWVLDDLVKGLPLRNIIQVPEHIAAPARLSLDRMFELS